MRSGTNKSDELPHKTIIIVCTNSVQDRVPHEVSVGQQGRHGVAGRSTHENGAATRVDGRQTFCHRATADDERNGGLKMRTLAMGNRIKLVNHNRNKSYLE